MMTLMAMVRTEAMAMAMAVAILPKPQCQQVCPTIRQCCVRSSLPSATSNEASRQPTRGIPPRPPEVLAEPGATSSATWTTCHRSRMRVRDCCRRPDPYRVLAAPLLLLHLPRPPPCHLLPLAALLLQATTPPPVRVRPATVRDAAPPS